MRARLARAAASPPTPLDLRPALEQAAAAGMRAAAMNRKSARYTIGGGKPLMLSFTGPGAKIASEVARRELARVLPGEIARVKQAAVEKLER